MIHRLIVLAVLPFTLTASSMHAATHAPAPPLPRTRTAVVCLDLKTTSPATWASARSEIAAAARGLIGSVPAVIYVLPVTDDAFSAPAVGEIVVPSIAPLHVPICTNPLDVPCHDAIKRLQAAHEGAVQRAMHSVNAQISTLDHAPVPRAAHQPDLLGCVAAAGTLFHRTTTNYLIMISAMEPAPAVHPHPTLYHPDLDVIWTPTGSGAQASATAHAWHVFFAPLVVDQGWLRPEQIMTWRPVDKS